MGCDIHAMIERRKTWPWLNADNTPHTSWINAGDPDLTRAYDIFSILTNCGRDRYGVEPISVGRGIPDDACDEFQTYCEWYGADGQSHGWATLRELRDYPLDTVPWPKSVAAGNREIWDGLIGELARVAARYDGDPDAVRLVFFFDN